MTPDRSASQKAALVTATLASFLTPFMASALNVALPSLGQEFAMDALLLSWVATAFLLVVPLASLIYGVIAGIKCSQGEDFQYWLIGDWAKQILDAN